MLCDKCSYQWAPRKETPKECPRCKTRLDYKQQITPVIIGGIQ